MHQRIIHLLSDDPQLGSHWGSAGQVQRPDRPGELAAHSLLVLDTAHPAVRAASTGEAAAWCSRLRVIVASSAPQDEEGLRWLELGAAGYCHAYAAPSTLQQVCEVVEAGELWVGRSLMARLLEALNRRRTQQADWEAALTEREREVARRAAEGVSNLAIASALGITERTVKAHLTAIFDKLGVADRLALALRVHGIH